MSYQRQGPHETRPDSPAVELFFKLLFAIIILGLVVVSALNSNVI